MESTVNRTIFDDNLTIVTEYMPQVRSTSIGIWVKVGSRHEDQVCMGLSHFVEHLLFKGSKVRSAQDFAKAFDAIGGQLDAFTGKEVCCYYAKVLDEHLPYVVELLADLVLNPRFDPQDLELERSVIIEEINMIEDAPEEQISDLFNQHYWLDHPLGFNSLGTLTSIQQISTKKAIGFHQKYYVRKNLLISAAGNIQHDKFVDLVEKWFYQISQGEIPEETPPQTNSSFISVNYKKLSQAHIYLGLPGLPVNHPHRYAGYLLETILGGGISSRLFQKIREQAGLAYAVYAQQIAHRDTGYLAIYAGVKTKNVSHVIDLILQELQNIKDYSIDQEELQRTKNQLKSALMLGLESTSARMMRLAKNELYFNYHFTLDENLAALEAVSDQDITNLARNLFQDEKYSLTTLGPKNHAKDLAKLFKVAMKVIDGTNKHLG